MPERIVVFPLVVVYYTDVAVGRAYIGMVRFQNFEPYRQGFLEVLDRLVVFALVAVYYTDVVVDLA